MLKWYEIAPGGRARPRRDRRSRPARLSPTRRASGSCGSAASLGFVILHRCGEDFYFLLLCTWQNENELWETVWAKDGECDHDFHPWPHRGGPHRPTFCVWELGAVAHEREAWSRFLRSARTATRGSTTSATRFQGTSCSRHAGLRACTVPDPRAAGTLRGMSTNAPDIEPVETHEWLDSVDAVVEVGRRDRMSFLLDRVVDRAQDLDVHTTAGALDPVRQHHPARGRAGDARRPGARAPRDGARPLERDRDRAPGERGVDRARRPHRELPVRGDALRGRLRPFLAGPLGGPSRRPRLPPGPLVPGLLRARVPRRAALRGRAAPLPAGGRRRRAVVVPAPVADAGVLAVPHRLDGARPADGDLPGAVHEVPRRARDRRARRPQGLGVHGRRRDGRARVDGRDLARGPRAPRQPRLRHQLQPAASRRPRAREREDHPGARDELPRRGLERDQGDLGLELGSRSSPRTTRASCAS